MNRNHGVEILAAEESGSLGARARGLIITLKKSGIRTVKDLKGKRVAVGPLGSGTEQNAIQILEAYGLKFEDLSKVERLTAAESADYLKDWRIDAAFYTVGVGASAIVDPAMMISTMIVPIDGAQADALVKKYPFYAKDKVPAGIYKGGDKDVPTVAVLAILVAKAEMEEDMVYRITKAMWDAGHCIVPAADEGIPNYPAELTRNQHPHHFTASMQV